MGAVVGRLCWAVIGGLVVHFGAKKPKGGVEHLAERQARLAAKLAHEEQNARARVVADERNAVAEQWRI